ncbi:MAG: uroporphyrinogen decarboxylase family protein [Terriglobia bacterium]
MTSLGSRIPVEVIFNPNWWFRHYGISFDESFYLDRGRRIANDVAMRHALHERFGIGDANPQPRPLIGSQYIAGGFVLPALLGVEIRFSRQEAAWPIPRNLTRQEIQALRVPDIRTAWPMNRLIADMDALEKEFGQVIGDVNTAGVFNTALEVRGQQLFIDLLEDKELVRHLFAVVAETEAAVAEYMRTRTGTTSVALNRSIVNVNPGIHVEGNCSGQMISPAIYRECLLPWHRCLAQRLAPLGIHHCGNNLHLFAAAYAETRSVFYDVGWGSDVARCSAELPDAFLNLRLNPVRLLHATAEEVRRDALTLLRAAGRDSQVGLCCINMDYGTPDENVEAIFAAAREFTL